MNGARALSMACLLVLMTGWLPSSSHAEDPSKQVTTNITYDDKGRIKSIAQPDGKKTRSFAYEGESTEILQVIIEEPHLRTRRTFTRTSGKTWDIRDAAGNYQGQWKGEVRLDKDGNYSLRAEGQEYWTSYSPQAETSFRYESPGVVAVLDEQHTLLTTELAGGDQLRYQRSADRSITAICIRRNGKETTWTVSAADKTWTADGSSEKRLAMSFDRNGVLFFVSADGTFWQQAPGDAAAQKVAYQFGGKQAGKARSELLARMSRELSAPALQRLLTNAQGFERRMADRAQARAVAGDDEKEAMAAVEAVVAGTYEQLTSMLDADKASAFFNEKTRALLAELFLYHTCDPTRSDQGQTGTCWIQSGHIDGMINRPDRMARLVRQVAEEGKFTTLNGGESGGNAKTVSFSKGLFDRMFNGPEAKFDMDKARSDGNVRSALGVLFDQTLPVLGGRAENASNMGNYWGSDGCRNIMYMVIGEVVYDEYNLPAGGSKKALLSRGAYITYLPGHMRTRQLKRVDCEWLIVQDDQMGDASDVIVERISDLKSWAGR